MIRTHASAQSDRAWQKKPARLTIIIVTWNVADLLRDCLHSIQETAGDLPHEVIVVDNASTDGVDAMIERDFPDVRFLRNSFNVGFPHANNQALPFGNSEYILYLNPDTRVGPGTLQRCVDILDHAPDIGLVGCRLDLTDGSVQPDGGRRAYRLRHLLIESAYLHMFFPRSRIFGDLNLTWWDHRDSREVEAVAGAFMMVRREIATDLGGLPEDLFMFHEDMSFCLRVRGRGWRIFYCGEVGILHYSQVSSSRSNLRLDLLRSECRFMLLREGQGAWAVLAGRLIWGLAGLLRLGVSWSRPLFPSAVRKYPRVFDSRTHLYQIGWSFAPALFAHMLPRRQEGASPSVVLHATTPANRE